MNDEKRVNTTKCMFVFDYICRVLNNSCPGKIR